MSSPRYRHLWKWLRPGLHIKRWIVTLILGFILLIVAVEVILLELLKTQNVDLLATPAWMRALGVPRELWIVSGVFVGVLMIVVSIFKLNQSLLSPAFDFPSTAATPPTGTQLGK